MCMHLLAKTDSRAKSASTLSGLLMAWCSLPFWPLGIWPLVLPPFLTPAHVCIVREVSLIPGVTEVVIFLRWKMKQGLKGHRLFLIKPAHVMDEFPKTKIAPRPQTQQKDPIYKKTKHSHAAGEPESHSLLLLVNTFHLQSHCSSPCLLLPHCSNNLISLLQAELSSYNWLFPWSVKSKQGPVYLAWHVPDVLSPGLPPASGWLVV